MDMKMCFFGNTGAAFDKSFEPVQNKTKQNKTRTSNITENMVLANHWPTVICCFSRSINWNLGVLWHPQIGHLNPSKTKPNQRETKNIGETKSLANF